MSKTIYVVACLALMVVFLFAAAPARGVRKMTIPDVGTVYVWSEDEMDKLEAAIERIIEERNALKRKVEQLNKSCT